MANCTTFLDANARFGDKPALIHPAGGTTYSYGQVLDYANRMGNALWERGIGRGDRVCIYLPSSAEYVLWYFAIWRIGAIAVPLNIVLREAEVLYMLNNSGAKCIITDNSGAEAVAAIHDNAETLAQVIVAGTDSWEEELSGVSSRTLAANCSFDDLCQLQYTSGTTGRQKGAMLTHGNWMAAMDAEREVLGLVEDDIFLGIYPMAHVGVSWGISALRAGATWVIMDRYNQDDYIDLIARYKATVVAGMPPVIHSLTRTPAGTEDSFRSVREMISGGGPLHPSIWKEFYRRFKIPVVNAYGLSETIVVGTGTAIRPVDYSTADEFQSVGMPVGFSEVKIVDVNDPAVEQGTGEVGEIALRGPAVASGYWKMPEETTAVFLPDGWFLTGDIGYLDSDGMLSITDRKKDMIVMSGWKIYPTEVEKVLIDHPGIEDVAIFGCPDEHRGEVPVAAVVPAGDSEITLDGMMEFCRKYLAGYKVPRKLVIMDELPRVSGWKLLRRELRDSYCGLTEP